MKKTLFFYLLFLMVTHLQAGQTTLLHDAAAHGNIQTIVYIFNTSVQSSDSSDSFSKFLLMLNAKDGDDQTAYDCARNKNQKSAAMLLSSLRKLCLAQKIKKDELNEDSYEMEMYVLRFVKAFLGETINQSKL